MHGSYSSDELKSLVRILNDILTEARKHRPDLSTDDVVQRVCTLADRGERDTGRFREAIFGTGDLLGAREMQTSSNWKIRIAGLQKAARPRNSRARSN